MAAYKGVFATGDRAVTMPSPLTATMPVYPDHDTFGAGVLLYRGDLARRITSYYRRRDGQASGCYLDELPQTLTKQIDDLIQNLSPLS
ncbi:hypothetical protein FRB99_005558 [Tulasnella sp. 403]|nr:hypothetical protein FRB99_005558 [Tulasnella sp. 403]